VLNKATCINENVPGRKGILECRQVPFHVNDFRNTFISSDANLKPKLVVAASVFSSELSSKPLHPGST
jgi:hypothetical protein